MDSSEIIDALDDLKHDLGKYLVMPVAMLESGASVDEVREAVAQALLQTRVGPRGPQSAAELWEAFMGAEGAALPNRAEVSVLEQAVRRALSWHGRIASGVVPQQHEVLADFRAVSEAIDGVVAAMSAREEPMDERGGA